jgi:hypothetical protein
MNPEVTKIGNKLFDKVELSSQKVEFAKSITEIEKAYNDGLTLNKQFDLAKAEYNKTAQLLAKIADDFEKKYFIAVMDGKDTLKAVNDLGITGADVNFLKTIISEMSGLRTKIGNPTDYKPRN